MWMLVISVPQAAIQDRQGYSEQVFIKSIPRKLTGTYPGNIRAAAKF
jgi:hypothetical protein